MVEAVSAADVTTQETSGGSGNRYVRSRYFTDGPQAFRIDFAEPGGVIKPHFHRVNQFQVIVDGDGTLGKKPVQAIAFHYTDGFTPYGPIVAGGAGISFFTIRAKPDRSGAHYMPESRQELERKAGRNEVRQLEPVAYVAGEAARQTLIERHPDGLAAFTVSAGPMTSFAGVETSPDGGQYSMVVEGQVRHSEQELPRMSCLWVQPGDLSPELDPVLRTVRVRRSGGVSDGGEPPFVVDGAEVGDRAVAPARVVPALDPLEDRRRQLGAGLPATAVEQLEL